MIATEKKPPQRTVPPVKPSWKYPLFPSPISFISMGSARPVGLGLAQSPSMPFGSIVPVFGKSSFITPHCCTSGDRPRSSADLDSNAILCRVLITISILPSSHAISGDKILRMSSALVFFDRFPFSGPFSLFDESKNEITKETTTPFFGKSIYSIKSSRNFWFSGIILGLGLSPILLFYM